MNATIFSRQLFLTCLLSALAIPTSWGSDVVIFSNRKDGAVSNSINLNLHSPLISFGTQAANPPTQKIIGQNGNGSSGQAGNGGQVNDSSHYGCLMSPKLSVTKIGESTAPPFSLGCGTHTTRAVFANAASFVACGRGCSADSAISRVRIHEGMVLELTEKGRYQVCFVVEIPATTTELCLQLRLPAKRCHQPGAAEKAHLIEDFDCLHCLNKSEEGSFRTISLPTIQLKGDLGSPTTLFRVNYLWESPALVGVFKYLDGFKNDCEQVLIVDGRHCLGIERVGSIITGQRP